MNSDRMTSQPEAQVSQTMSSGPVPSTCSGPSLSPPAVSFIAGIIGVSLLAAALACFESAPHSVGIVLVWTLATLAGELMLFPTLTQRGHISLSTTMHLAMVLVLDPGQLVAAMLLSRGLVMFIVQRQIWYRALFNVSLATGAVVVASYVFQLLLGGGVVSFAQDDILRLTPAFVTAAILYYGICAAASSGILALTTRDSLWRVWRENFGYGAELIATAGLVLLAPVMALCFQSGGWVGLLVFLVPMALVRATSTRYISLRQSQQTLVAAERLAAKGEIAAEVGHDIKNFLHGISAQLQFMQRKGPQMEMEEYARRIRLAMEQLEKANALSEGLMAFTCRDSKFMPTRLTDLVESTVRFLTPQRRFDGVHIELDLDRRMGEVLVDPNQIQQMLMNLMINGANAMHEAGTLKRTLWVTIRAHETSNQIEMMVADSGPGVSDALKDRIFEPGFTTREEGHGFGLATVHRVATNHLGQVRLEDNPGGGALFRIFMPLRRSGDAETRRAA